MIVQKQRDINKREAMTEAIYDAYMHPNAPQEVFFSKKLIDAVVHGSSFPKPSLYNAILKEVKDRLEVVHPRFILTAPFKQLEELYD
ncbi:hypothetical protein CAEBREN_07860 [Caenorhabditis brenneri]|uniref:RGS domain-containing protein n=1 Tax=Caenorhabditis brenneri TaxID=135651 RepID=G0P1A6_CAEBE|nr:hypothetical protein CAEBREN_07860 [Caenorhabditis brenneri]